MQLDVNIKINPDETGEINERLRFSLKMLATKSKDVNGKGLKWHLSKEAAIERAGHFGKGVSVAKHEMVDLKNGSSEARVTYRFTNLKEVRFPGPYLGLKSSVKAQMKLDFMPVYKKRWASPDVPGWMVLILGNEGLTPDKKATAKKELSPLELQKFHLLRPVLQDMWKGLQLRITLEGYSDFTNGWNTYLGVPNFIKKRGTQESTPIWVLFDVSDKNLDWDGRSIFNNQEYMLDVARGDFKGKGIAAVQISNRHKSFTGKAELPYFHYKGPSYSFIRRLLKPTKQQFEKFFKGKPESQGGDVKNK